MITPREAEGYQIHEVWGEIQRTKKAVLLEIVDGDGVVTEIWLPLSQIDFTDTENGREVWIPKWLAEEKEIVI